MVSIKINTSMKSITFSIVVWAGFDCFFPHGWQNKHEYKLKQINLILSLPSQNKFFIFVHMR